MSVLSHIEIDENSRKPKYLQIVDSIILNISNANFSIDEKLPSINMLSEEFYLSRDTVEKAYRVLRERKIINSVRGKGYYIARTELITKTNILFLFNKLSTYKLKIYNSFIESIGTSAHVDLQIYHCDESLFLNLLDKYRGAYDYYAIMTHFKDENLKFSKTPSNIFKAIKKIAPEKLILLDIIDLDLAGNGIEIFQDFENDLYQALMKGIEKISKYKKLILVYPTKAVYPYPLRIKIGFQKFCVDNTIDFEIIDEVFEEMILKKGDLFITIKEGDLVNLMHRVKEEQFILGTDVGILSYNETPLKELLGVSVVSTDFDLMGKTIAEMIKKNKKGRVKNPFNFIDRDSM